MNYFGQVNILMKNKTEQVKSCNTWKLHSWQDIKWGKKMMESKKFNTVINFYNFPMYKMSNCDFIVLLILDILMAIKAWFVYALKKMKSE